MMARSAEDEDVDGDVGGDVGDGADVDGSGAEVVGEGVDGDDDDGDGDGAGDGDGDDVDVDAGDDAGDDDGVNRCTIVSPPLDAATGAGSCQDIPTKNPTPKASGAMINTSRNSFSDLGSEII
jgi:hypothetical protein